MSFAVGIEVSPHAPHYRSVVLGPGQEPEILRMRNGQRIEQGRFGHSENRRIRSDAQREGSNRNCCEAGTLAQRADAVAQICAEFTPQAQAERCAYSVFVGLDAAELDACPAHRFSLGNTAAGQICGVAFDMEAHLRLHFAFQLPWFDDPLAPRSETHEKSHISSGVVCRMPAINDAIRFHFSVSEWSWRRPAGVRL